MTSLRLHLRSRTPLKAMVIPEKAPGLVHLAVSHGGGPDAILSFVKLMGFSPRHLDHHLVIRLDFPAGATSQRLLYLVNETSALSLFYQLRDCLVTYKRLDKKSLAWNFRCCWHRITQTKQEAKQALSTETWRCQRCQKIWPHWLDKLSRYDSKQSSILFSFFTEFFKTILKKLMTNFK